MRARTYTADAAVTHDPGRGGCAALGGRSARTIPRRETSTLRRVLKRGRPPHHFGGEMIPWEGRLLPKAISGDFRPDEDDPMTFLESLPVPPEQHDQAEASERAEIIAGELGRLRPRDRLILTLRFGLDGGDGLALEEIGRLLHPPVCRERVRQLERDALLKLGPELAARLGLPAPPKRNGVRRPTPTVPGARLCGCCSDWREPERFTGEYKTCDVCRARKRRQSGRRRVNARKASAARVARHA